MAITIVDTLQTNKGDYKYRHLARAIPYACNPLKTRGGILSGAYNCLPETALKQMIMTKERFGKTDGRQGYHFEICFVKGEVSSEVAYQIIEEFTREYLSTRFEVVFGIHEDKAHIHGHIVFNSVSVADGKKYHYKKGDWKRNIQPIVNRLCEERNLSTIDLNRPKQRRGKNYRVWANERAGKVTHLSLLKGDIDYYIKKARNYSSFISLLRGNGYDVKDGVHIAIRLKGKEQERFRRLDTCFGENYMPDAIKERISKEVFVEEPEHKGKHVLKAIEPFEYRRAKLTPFQRKYFCKLYRTGQMRKRSFPQSWKYRDDIVRLGKLQEQFIYIWKKGIKTLEGLKAREELLQQRYQELESGREEIYQVRRDNRIGFELLEEYHLLKNRAELFEAGESCFEDDYNKVEKIKMAFNDLGINIAKVEELRSATKEALDKISKTRGEIRKELSLCKRTQAESLETANRPRRIDKRRVRTR